MTQPDFSKVEETISQAIERKAFDCPHCSGKIYLDQVATLPAEQTFSITLESSTGSFCARTVGETITNLDKLMKSIAKDIGGKVEMFVESMNVSGKSLSVGFLVTSVAQQKEKKK